MIDIKLLRSDPEKIKKSLLIRSPKNAALFEELIAKDALYKKALKEAEDLRNERNDISSKIAGYKIAKQQPPEDLTAKAAQIKENTALKEAAALEREKETMTILMNIPNLLDETVIEGKSEADNKVIKEDISHKREFSFKPLDHHTLGERLGILDFERAAKLSGSRFCLLKDKGAKLERALIQFMLDTHCSMSGYTEMFTPVLVNAKTMTGTGQLPKFEEDLYKTNDDAPMYMIPTAEVTLTNIHAEEILDEAVLPLKYTAFSSCFRKESGSYGKDTRGLIRNHQFNKVELVNIVAPEFSAEALNQMLAAAESILKALKLPYRVLQLCSADIGFSAAKTYDLEVWFPSENRFIEISSCSNCKDFQARRMNLRFKRKGGKPEFAHTLNGSGLALGRTFAAILENYQRENLSIEVPEVLVKYTGFDKIG